MVLGYALKAKSDRAVHAREDCWNFVASAERDQGCRSAQADGDFLDAWDIRSLSTIDSATMPPSQSRMG